MTLPDGNVIPPTGKAFDLEFAQTSKWDGRGAGRLAALEPREPAGTALLISAPQRKPPVCAWGAPVVDHVRAAVADTR
jgi:hypothetical protein